MVTLLLGLVMQDPGATRAESLLAAHDLPAARRAAEQLVRERPRDAGAHLLLGRVWLAWPTVGRYDALTQFRTAARLAPGDPEPLYRQAEAGFRLGSDDGEWIAREALLRLFALQSDYRDAWARFAALYHDDDVWRRLDRALAGHPDDPTALERRAVAALGLREPQRADSLATEGLRRRAASVPLWLVRAEAGFEAGHDAAGYAWYDSALAHADVDSTGALWGQVWMIASPAEAARFDSTAPRDARAFFQWFWGKRDPNLVTPENERIAEHFHRLSYARRQFHVLHPLGLYGRSAHYRALAATGARDLLAALPAGSDSFVVLVGNTPVRKPRGSRALGRADSAAAATRQAPDVRAAGDTGATPSDALTHLDPRGVVWVRHGPPDQRLPRVLDPLHPEPIGAASALDLESWLYFTPEGPRTIAFVRGSAGLAGGQLGGDFIFFPATSHQLASVRQLLVTDRTTLPASLAARVWGAFYRAADGRRTDVYYRAAPDSAAAVLWDADGGAAGRATGPGLLRLRVRPGRYVLGLDVDSAGAVGRLRHDVTVPDFTAPAPGPPALSSLALGAADTTADRETTLSAMPADLTYDAGRPLATYAEIYGLDADARGVARYLVRYSFARVRSFLDRVLGAGHAVVLEFTREVATPDVALERVVLEPGRLPAGRYRVTLGVTDLARNVKAESVALEIVMR